MLRRDVMCHILRMILMTMARSPSQTTKWYQTSVQLHKEPVVASHCAMQAKKFDQDSNGIIDKEEMDAGKRIIAKELWDKHRAQHFLGKVNGA